MNDYPDINDNGIPDVFENRLTITQILQGEEHLTTSAKTVEPEAVSGPPTITLELEIAKRPPREGEMYLDGLDGTVRIEKYSGGMSELIVKRIISAPPYWKPIKE